NTVSTGRSSPVPEGSSAAELGGPPTSGLPSSTTSGHVPAAPAPGVAEQSAEAGVVAPGSPWWLLTLVALLGGLLVGWGATWLPWPGDEPPASDQQPSPGEGSTGPGVSEGAP